MLVSLLLRLLLVMGLLITLLVMVGLLHLFGEVIPMVMIIMMVLVHPLLGVLALVVGWFRHLLDIVII